MHCTAARLPPTADPKRAVSGRGAASDGHPRPDSTSRRARLPARPPDRALCAHRSASKASSSSRSSSVVAQAVPVEVAQVAGEAGFIAGTSLTMFAITLVVRGHRRAPRLASLAANRPCAVDGMRIASLYRSRCRSPAAALPHQASRARAHRCCTCAPRPPAGPGHGLRAAARGVSGRGGQALSWLAERSAGTAVPSILHASSLVNVCLSRARAHRVSGRSRQAAARRTGLAVA